MAANGLRWIAAAVLIVASLGGCAHVQRPWFESASDLNWRDAKPLASFETDGQGTKYSITADCQLALDSSADPIYFALASPVDQSVGCKPLVVRKAGGRWMALKAMEDGHGWMFAAKGPGRAEIWAFLDSVQEDRGWDLLILHSTDGGATWKGSGLGKIHYTAEMTDFTLGADGQGCITLRMDDCACPIRPGYYRYHTADGGKSWSQPEYVSNDLTPAQRTDIGSSAMLPAPWAH
jgi:hypothetical protein